MKYLMSAVLIAGLSLGASANAASIPFADHRGIDDWHSDDDNTVYLRAGSDKRWFKADLFGPCDGLRFATTIGYKPTLVGTFDETSSIIVEGRECRLMKLEPSEDPTKKKNVEKKN